MQLGMRQLAGQFLETGIDMIAGKQGLKHGLVALLDGGLPTNSADELVDASCGGRHDEIFAVVDRELLEIQPHDGHGRLVDGIHLLKVLFFLAEKDVVGGLKACLVDEPVLGAHEDFACRWVCERCLFVPCNTGDGDALAIIVVLIYSNIIYLLLL